MIDNAEESRIIKEDIADGLSDITAPTELYREYFDISGNKVSSATPGLRIVLRHMSDGTICTSKEFNR